MNAKITLEGTGFYFRWTCDVCGETQGRDGMKSCIEEDGETMDICRTCLEAGKDGAIERAANHANRLQKYVDFLKQEFPEIVHSIDEWKTGADYDRVSNEFEKQIREEIEREEAEAKTKKKTEPIQDDNEFPF